jgi:hypothetical protein
MIAPKRNLEIECRHIIIERRPWISASTIGSSLVSAIKVLSRRNLPSHFHVVSVAHAGSVAPDHVRLCNFQKNVPLWRNEDGAGVDFADLTIRGALGRIVRDRTAFLVLRASFMSSLRFMKHPFGADLVGKEYSRFETARRRLSMRLGRRCFELLRQSNDG